MSQTYKDISQVTEHHLYRIIFDIYQQTYHLKKVILTEQFETWELVDDD